MDNHPYGFSAVLSMPCSQRRIQITSDSVGTIDSQAAVTCWTAVSDQHAELQAVTLERDEAKLQLKQETEIQSERIIKLRKEIIYVTNSHEEEKGRQ
jgi:hypothetical protein